MDHPERPPGGVEHPGQRAVAMFPGQAVYLQTDQLFAPHDRFFTWTRTPTGAWIRARKLDNTHMCPYGAAELGSLIVDDLTPVLGLAAMAPGGGLGSWIHDANFNDPPGACPDDQPPPRYAGVIVPGPPFVSPGVMRNRSASMDIDITPIGVVVGGRQATTDDHWGSVEATIELDPQATRTRRHGGSGRLLPHRGGVSL